MVPLPIWSRPEILGSIRETGTSKDILHVRLAFLRSPRQNIAEIDEIPFEEHIELIDLPAAERALERELEHTLKAQDMMLRRGKKKDSDRDTRISDITKDSR